VTSDVAVFILETAGMVWTTFGSSTVSYFIRSWVWLVYDYVVLLQIEPDQKVLFFCVQFLKKQHVMVRASYTLKGPIHPKGPHTP